jgi:hypothetical protein
MHKPHSILDVSILIRLVQMQSRRVVPILTLDFFMVKSRPPRNATGAFGGMAERLKAHVLKTCLGHTNVGSNPTPSALSCKQNLGRCQSGRMGPPAKRLLGRNPQSQVRILSSPPHENTSEFETCFRFQSHAPLRGDIRILPSPPHEDEFFQERVFVFSRTVRLLME